MFSAALLVLTVLVPLASSSAWDVFRDRWAGQTVTLKQPIYTIMATKAGGVLESSGADTVHVTRIAPDKGIFYAGLFNSHEYQDRDVNQLVDKATAATATMTKQTNITRYETVEGAPAKLITFKAGSRMRVKQVRRFRRYLIFELYDDLTTKGKPSTELLIEFPAGVSDAFSEEPVVTELAGQFFER